MFGLQYCLDQTPSAMCTIFLCSIKISLQATQFPTKRINLVSIRTRPDCKNSREYFIVPLPAVWISLIGFIRGWLSYLLCFSGF